MPSVHGMLYMIDDSKKEGLSGEPEATEPSNAPEMLSQRGAIRLARRLEKYWHDRGYPATRFWAEPIDERFSKVGTYHVHRVVSNLANELPPRYRE